MPCQSGRKAGALAGLLSIAVAAPAAAGPAGWAHQAASFQSNGAVTVKSLFGGSYSGTQNPTGAVAKTNQSAATQAPTVIIQATGAAIPVMMFTATAYQGNFGGIAGGNAICAAEFGPTWKFAENGKIVSGVPPTSIPPGGAWVHDAPSGAGNTCIGWATNSNTTYGWTLTGGGASTAWTVNNATCDAKRRLACINF